jgi:NAD(P)H-hydrate repair Nnr-like enzyme with NAD(P)H-hydrate dehydratase domain
VVAGPGSDAHGAVAAAVWLHGRAAEHGDIRLPLRAGDLIDVMAASLWR